MSKGGFFLAFLLLLMATYAPANASVEFETSELVPHAPIRIEGDLAFTSHNGVVSGSGTESDPYVIEGWEISNNAGPGTLVSRTTAHFVIQEVSVHYTGEVPSDDMERAFFIDEARQV